MTAIKNGTLLVKDSNGNTARVATLSQTDITTLNTALADIGTNSVSIQSLTNQVKTIQGRYVDVDTAQTITGRKTFTADVTVLKNTNFDALTTEKGKFVSRIISQDKNGLDCNYINFWQSNDEVGNYKRLSTTSIGVNLNRDDGTNVSGNIHIDGVLDKSGAVNFYAYAPNPASNSNDTSIATTSWVNNKVNPIKDNYVTTNTVQDITAIKTIVLPSNQHAIIVKDKSIANTDTPSPSAWQSMVLTVDKNGKERGCVQSILRHDGSSCTKLMAIQQNAKGENIYNSLELGIKADGTRHTYVLPPSSNSNDNNIATTRWVRSYIMPAGSIIPFAGSSIPTGYLLCNGAVVSRTTYADLFRVIGTTYGAGDGSTTFKLPDLRDRFLEGAGTNAIGRYLSAGLPNITGDSNVAAYWYTRAVTTGCFIPSPEWDANTTFSAQPKNGTNSAKIIWFDASKSNTTYGSSSTVQPKSMAVQYLIKY